MDNSDLVIQFRRAIELAKNAGEFEGISPFCNFPRACCGDTSDLLAQFLLENRIETYYFCGTFNTESLEDKQSHAWLLTEDNTIIDITGDQFKEEANFFYYNKPVYIGKMDAFHALFKKYEYGLHEGIESLGSDCHFRLKGLYKKIIKYL